MNNAAAGQVIIFITSLNNAVTEIDIFSVHKKPFVKAAGFLQHFLFYHHIGTRQHVYLIIAFFGKVAQVIPGNGF